MHRRHHYSLSKTSSAVASDNEESLFSPAPSIRSESQATTPGLSEVGSTLSPGNMGGEESFFGFMSRMVKVYIEEEEVRAKHQDTLLELREKAIRDKTNVRGERGKEWGGGRGGGGWLRWALIGRLITLVMVCSVAPILENVHRYTDINSN